MFGFWFGINLMLPFVAIYWLIKPDFLFYKHPLNRQKVALIISIIAFIDVVLLVLVAISPKNVNDYDIIGFIIGVMIFFGFGAWRFYRYGQYSILSKLPTQTTPIAEPKPSIITNNYPLIDNTIADNNAQNNSDISQDETQNTPQITEPIETSTGAIEIPLPIQDTPNHSDSHSDTAINQTEKDWQAYKQKMEQSWQETRTKIAQKSGEK